MFYMCHFKLLAVNLQHILCKKALSVSQDYVIGVTAVRSGCLGTCLQRSLMPVWGHVFNSVDFLFFGLLFLVHFLGVFFFFSCMDMIMHMLSHV